MRVYLLMTSINMSIRELKVSGNVSSVLVSYVFDDVHFLCFGDVKMLLLPFHTWGQFTCHSAEQAIMLIEQDHKDTNKDTQA